MTAGLLQAIKEQQALIFEPFTTLEPSVPGASREGTGLGLYLVEEIINEHRGVIAVENRPEGGARFSIWLPLERAAPGEQEAS